MDIKVTVQKIIGIMMFVLMAGTLFLLLFISPGTEYFLKLILPHSNLVLLISGIVIAVGILMVFSLINRFLIRSLPGDLPPHAAAIVITLLSIILFIGEVIYTYSAFFYSDWDPAGILDCVYKLLRGNPSEISLDYFSAHPNNLMLVVIYLSILKIAGLFGTESVLFLVFFQSLLFTVGGVLFFYIVSDLISRKTAFFAWIIYALWIGFNPYLIITYSDAMGLIFPLLVLRLLQLFFRKRTFKERVLPAVLMGIAAAFGYAVKPQTVIMYIAVLMMMAVFALSEKTAGIIVQITVSAAVFILTGLIITSLIYPTLKLDLNKNRSFSFSHYLMMGLNPETDGVYSNEDTEFTNAIPSPAERKAENLRVAGERVKAYGVKGMAGHLVRKQLINFGDGSFSWGIDGNFFAGTDFGDMPEVKEDSPLRTFILSFIVMGEENYLSFMEIMQMIWLTVLFFITAGSLMALKDPGDGYVLNAVYLSLTGLTLFELIFEAKARYLFTFTPVFLLAGVYGVYGLYRRLKEKRTS